MFKYFKQEEFECKCGCGKNNVDYEFLTRLDIARGKAGIPFVINSGCRCAEHNKNVGGSDTSSHLKGIAADIRCANNTELWSIIHGLMYAGFKRVGIAKNFVHVDADTTKTQKVMFKY